MQATVGLLVEIRAVQSCRSIPQWLTRLRRIAIVSSVSAYASWSPLSSIDALATCTSQVGPMNTTVAARTYPWLAGLTSLGQGAPAPSSASKYVAVTTGSSAPFCPTSTTSGASASVEIATWPLYSFPSGGAT